MPMDPERQKLCDDIGSAIVDEGSAVDMYGGVQSKLEESDNPGVRTLGLTVWIIKKDEEKHGEALKDLQRLLCPTF